MARRSYSPTSFIQEGMEKAAKLIGLQQEEQKAAQSAAQPALPSNPQFKITPPPTSQVLPDLQNYDYRTATTTIRGVPIRKTTAFGIDVTPIGFTPQGEFYFGAGPGGWLKGFAHHLFAQTDTAEGQQKKWDAFYAAVKEEVSSGIRLLPGEEEKAAQQKRTQTMFQTLYEAASSSGAQADRPLPEITSPLAPGVRMTNALVKAAIDFFSFAADVPERSQKVLQEMREFADLQGSPLPDLAVDDEGVDEALSEIETVQSGELTLDPKSKTAIVGTDARVKLDADFTNFLSRWFIPYLSGYDAVRFWTAPGTKEQKQRVVQAGWIEGRMLYTELIHPMVEAEYKRRAAAGEDPVLLTMELQDPWAEIVGEVIFDPFNIVGPIARARKTATLLAETLDTVENSGPLADPAFRKLMDVDNLSTPAQSSARINELADYFVKYKPDLRQSYKATALTSAGNQVRHQKIINMYLSNVIQTYKVNGGTLDDVVEYVVGLVLRASDNVDDVKRGLTILRHSPMGKLAFNEAAMETGYVLRQVMGNGDEFVESIRKAGTNWTELNKLLDTRTKKALGFVFPSVKDMVKAEERVKALQATQNDLALSERLAGLRKSNPGVVEVARFHSVLDSIASPINGFLSNFYFSLSYGYAFRNYIQNMFTIAVDGWRLTDGFKDGLRTGALDDFLTSQGINPNRWDKTFVETVTENSFLKQMFSKINKWGFSPFALANWAETYASKLIYVKKYRESMDTAVQLGVAFPRIAEWEARGFTAAQAGDFVEIVKANGYDVNTAIKIFNKKYASGSYDAWTTLDYIQPQVREWLRGEGYWDEIVKLSHSDNVKLSDITAKIDELKQQVRNKASAARYEFPAKSLETEDWKEIADAQKISDGRFSVVMANEEITLQNAADQAILEFDEALNTVRRKLPPGDFRSSRIADWLGSIEHRKQTMNIRATVTQRRLKVQDLYDQAKKRGDLRNLWDEEIMGKMPDEVTYDIFTDALWKNGYFNYKMRLWNGYYETYLNGAKALAEEVGITEIFSKADKALLDLNHYRNAVFTQEGVHLRPQKFYPSNLGETQHANNIRALAVSYGILPKSRSAAQADKRWLTIINQVSDTPYARLEDVPANVAEKAFAKYVNVDPVGFIKQNKDGTTIPNDVPDSRLVRIPPPRDPNDASFPTLGRRAYETQQQTIDALNHVRDEIRRNWGLKNPAGNANVADLLTGVQERMAIARERSMRFAEYWRDFALLPYGETRHIDLALSLVFPYQFWYRGTYTNWLKRGFTNSDLLSKYANLKDEIARQNSELPDWWKFQVSPQKLLGIDTDNPVYFNLEAMIWPLYGITGTDFNDPDRRANWFAALVDDMGKFGPSVWAPINLSLAAYFALQGEREIASKWGGRLIPQTAAIKALSSFWGTPIELDPNVRLFDPDGAFSANPMDQYEEARVSRALAAMKAEGVYTEQELLEAARTHTGEVWEEAYRRATQKRAPGQLMSFFFGVGFKPRTQEDIETDNFYADYYRLRNLRDGEVISPEQYQQGFNELRERYPFMDILLLSRRAGMGRESAYAYNVISRIPPGMTREMYQAAGIDPETAEKFYELGGKFTGMSEAEKMEFMSGMINLGAMLEIPSDTTRREWSQARQMYREMTDFMKEDFGEDIMERIGMYHKFDDPKEARAYLDANPDVAEAMDARTAYIANTPELLRYYGGMEVLERYYTSIMYDELEEKFGTEIRATLQDYYDLWYDPKAQRKFKREHPEIQQYLDARDAGYENILRQMVAFGELLPAAPEVQLTGNEPVGARQRAIVEAAVPPVPLTVEQWRQEVGEPLMFFIADFYYNDQELPYNAQRQLERLAKQYGFDDDNEMLQAILLSMAAER